MATDPKDMTRLVAEWRELTSTMSGRSFLAVGDDMAAGITTLLEEVGRYREALELARNRLRAAAINEAPKGTREYYEYSEWADAADAALQGSVDRLNDERISE